MLLEPGQQAHHGMHITQSGFCLIAVAVVVQAALQIASAASNNAFDDQYPSPYTVEAVRQGMDLPWWEKLLGARFRDGRLQLARLTVCRFAAACEGLPLYHVHHHPQSFKPSLLQIHLMLNVAVQQESYIHLFLDPVKVWSVLAFCFVGWTGQ